MGCWERRLAGTKMQRSEGTRGILGTVKNQSGKVGKIPWRKKWQPLQYSCQDNPMDRGAWRTTVHGIARVRHDLVTKQQDILRACSLPSNSKYRELIKTSIYL